MLKSRVEYKQAKPYIQVEAPTTIVVTRNIRTYVVANDSPEGCAKMVNATHVTELVLADGFNPVVGDVVATINYSEIGGSIYWSLSQYHSHRMRQPISKHALLPETEPAYLLGCSSMSNQC
jgi:hypothetical protein